MTALHATLSVGHNCAGVVVSRHCDRFSCPFLLHHWAPVSAPGRGTTGGTSGGLGGITTQSSTFPGHSTTALIWAPGNLQWFPSSDHVPSFDMATHFSPSQTPSGSSASSFFVQNPSGCPP